MKPKLVLIGNGMAGVRTLEELLRLAPDHYDITVFGAEPHGNYNRILLSPVLAGEKTVADIITHDLNWYRSKGITLHTGKPVTAIDRKRRRVIADDLTVDYDRLLIATGSKPIRLPIPGADLDGVLTFRDLFDVHTLIDIAASEQRRATVIGGGLLGLEAAVGLQKRGMEVTVVHRGSTLLDRQLDRTAGHMLRDNLERWGIGFRMKADTAAILGKDRVTGVVFKDGSETASDLVVMAVGVQPDAELAWQAGLHCERGIVVDDTLQTYDPRIYAVGECVQHRRQTYGLVAPLWEQARVCANHLAGFGIGRYPGSLIFTRLKVTGIDLFSAGDFNGDGELLVLKDPALNFYKKLVIRNDRLQGVVLYGDTRDANGYLDLIFEGTPLGSLRDTVIFDPARQAA